MSTVTVNRPYPPMLLLSPDGSRDREGSVSPTIDGSAPVVAGEYGNAWNVTSGQITTPSLAGHGHEGTVLIRTLHTGDTSQSSARLFTTNISALAPRIQIFHTTSRLLRVNTPTANQTMASGFPPNQWSFIAIRWDGTTIDVPDFDFTGAMSADLTEGQMRLSSTSNGARWFGLVESMLVFDIALSDEEIDAINGLDEAWTWQNVGQQVLRPVEVSPTFPAYRSGVFAIEASVYKTDRLNHAREDISRYLTDLAVNGDIDRVASKLQCSISTYREVIADGDWIAPYLAYLPETGEPITTQMGHYRLDTPGVVYDGTGAEHTQAIGMDILEMMADATLPTTFYTPRGGNINQDIQTLISMATRGQVGANMVQNPSFEAVDGSGNLTGWANNGTFGSGGSGDILWTTPGYDIPSGERAWGPRFNASQPSGALAQVSQSIPIPSHLIGERIWVSGLWLPAHREHRGYLIVSFFDASNTLIPGANVTTPIVMRPPLRWTREQAWTHIPENATRMTVQAVVRDAVGGFAGQRRSSWDDITIQTISGDPLPESRIALPADAMIASSRIQSVAGTSYLTAINDRLAAAGYHALFTTMDGRLTTRRNRSAATDTPARVYTPDDSRIVDVVEVTRNPGNRYNTVVALKEDLLAGTSMAAIAQNLDASDEWSVPRMGRVDREITIQDAVDQDALQEAADAELARASMQENLFLSVLPDPTLTVHDIVRVEADNRAAGQWAVDALEWGMSVEDPLVRVNARRTITSGRVA